MDRGVVIRSTIAGLIVAALVWFFLPVTSTQVIGGEANQPQCQGGQECHPTSTPTQTLTPTSTPTATSTAVPPTATSSPTPTSVLPSSLGGHKWWDCDGSASVDQCREKKPGWMIFLCEGEIHSTEACQANLTSSQATNDDGTYGFPDLEPGIWTVCEEVRQGWITEGPVCQTRDLSNGTSDWNVNFLNLPPPLPGTINGHKSDQLNRKVQGVTIQLKQDDVVIDTRTTDVDGYYEFRDVPNGEYTVCEVVPDGMIPEGDTCKDVTVDSNQLSVDFVNRQLVTLQGHKWWDCSGPGIPVCTEAKLGWQFWLCQGDRRSDPDGCWTDRLGESITNSDAVWNFPDIPAGIYTVCEETREGWTPITGICQTIDLSDGSSKFNLDFVNRPPPLPMSLGGHKRDAVSGAMIPNWKIHVVDQATNEEVATPVTNGDGYWEVRDLPVSTYQVCEEVVSGWEATTAVCRTISDGLSHFDIDFWNQQVPGPTTTPTPITSTTTPTNTPTNTPTVVPTGTLVPTSTPTNTPTGTIVPPTATAIPTSTSVPPGPTATLTKTPVKGVVLTATPSPEPPTATPVKGGPTVTGLPPAGFGPDGQPLRQVVERLNPWLVGMIVLASALASAGATAVLQLFMFARQERRLQA